MLSVLLFSPVGQMHHRPFFVSTIRVHLKINLSLFSPPLFLSLSETKALIKPGEELDQHIDSRKGTVCVFWGCDAYGEADSIVRLLLSLHLANSDFGGHGCTKTVEKGSLYKRLESQG